MRRRLLPLVAFAAGMVSTAALADSMVQGRALASGGVVHSTRRSDASGMGSNPLVGQTDAAAASGGAGADVTSSRRAGEYPASGFSTARNSGRCVTSRSVFCVRDGDVVTGWTADDK